MPDQIVSQPTYPYNLLFAVKAASSAEVPTKLSADILAGLEYALSSLPDREQKLIQLHYAEGRSAIESAALLSVSLEQVNQLKTSIIKKLRQPGRWNYIQYGIAGNLRQEAQRQYNRGYHAGYVEGHKDGSRAALSGGPIADPEADVLSQPVEFLNLSTHARHCLQLANYRTIQDVVSIDTDRILSIRNMGKKTAAEIAKALQNLGILHTAWYQYL